MEDKGIKQESNASAAGIYEKSGEPAVVIDGVPDIILGDCTVAHAKMETHVPSGSFGLCEWFEGREVRKWFMGRYYSGTVPEYDKDAGWYRVHYEDGDSEDVDWQELEEVLERKIKATLKIYMRRSRIRTINLQPLLRCCNTK